MPEFSLRERVTFSFRAVSSDGYGNNSGSFVDQFTTAARIRPRLGGEEVMAARLQGKSLANIIVRCTPATLLIQANWRVVDDRTGDIWNITAPPVNVDEKKQFLEMLCEKGVAV